MADVFSKEKRSEIMSHIRGKDTGIEIAVRRFLFSRGFRYRKNDPRYPGRPDIVLPKYRAVVFVNGCFWHGHENCRIASVPKSRTEYWSRKISANRERDRRNAEALESEGWNVIVVWECELRTDQSRRLESLVEEIKEGKRGGKKQAT